MAKRGGVRPGAGRRPNTDAHAKATVAAERLIARRLPELIDNLFVLANGVTVQLPTPTGGTQVYTRAPDGKANEYLLNRIMGKPVERLEHTGEVGGDIALTSPALEKAAAALDEWRSAMARKLLALTDQTDDAVIDVEIEPDAPPTADHGPEPSG